MAVPTFMSRPNGKLTAEMFYFQYGKKRKVRKKLFQFEKKCFKSNSCFT